MQYMLIIHNDPSLHPKPGETGWDDLLTDYFAFNQHLEAQKIKFSGDPLMPPQTATTVRIRDNKSITTDGPFAETKEWMSGYYLVEVENLDVALELANLIPSAKFGSVEIRPVLQMQPAGR